MNNKIKIIPCVVHISLEPETHMQFLKALAITWGNNQKGKKGTNFFVLYKVDHHKMVDSPHKINTVSAILQEDFCK